MSKKFGRSIESIESEPRQKIIPLNQSIGIIIYCIRWVIMTVSSQTLLKVINHVILMVAQNTVDYEALDLYTVNVS